MQAEQVESAQVDPYAPFERSRIAAEIALKDWFVELLKESLVKVK